MSKNKFKQTEFGDIPKAWQKSRVGDHIELAYGDGLPSLPEQRAIVKILSDLDEKIEINHQMNKTLEFIAQAIFKRWFVDFEFPDKNGKSYKSSGGKMVDSELGEIPEGWHINELGDFTEILNGFAFKSEDFVNSGIFLL